MKTINRVIVIAVAAGTLALASCSDMFWAGITVYGETLSAVHGATDMGAAPFNRAQEKSRAESLAEIARLEGHGDPERVHRSLAARHQPDQHVDCYQPSKEQLKARIKELQTGAKPEEPSPLK